MHLLDLNFKCLQLLLVIIIWELEINLITLFWLSVDIVKVTIPSDSASKVHVLFHYCSTFGMNSAEVCVLKESNNVSFSSFLEGYKCLRLKSELMVNITNKCANESLKWSTRKQTFDVFLIALNLTEHNCTLLVPDFSFFASLDSTFSWSSLLNGLALAHHLLLFGIQDFLRLLVISDGFSCYS